MKLWAKVLIIIGIIGLILSLVYVIGTQQVEKNLMQEDLYWACEYANDLTGLVNDQAYYLFEDNSYENLEEMDCFELFDYTNYN